MSGLKKVDGYKSLVVVSRSTEQKEAPANARVKANIYGHARPLRGSLFPASTNSIVMVMFCAAWTLVDRRTEVRYDRNMEFVVAVVVRRKRFVLPALATLEVKSEFGCCDLFSFGERPILDFAETLDQRARPFVTNPVHLCRTLLQALLCIRIQMTCRTPRKGYHSPLAYSTTSQNRHDAGRST